MFLYVFLGFLSSFVFVAQCAQEVIAESVNSVGHQYLGCVRALAAHPELQGQFQKIMGWVVEGKKAPKTFEIEAPILIKRLERELSPKEALLIVSFAQSVYQRAKYRRWGKNALIGVGVAGAGVGLGYGVHRYLKKNDIPNEESAARQEESVNVAINKGGALAISSPDALSIGTAVGTSAEQSSMPEKQAEREKRKQKKAGGRPNKRRKHGSLLAIDSGEAEVGQENLLPAEEYHFKADAELHGNKAANLAKLHEFCKKHSPYIKEKTGYELRVPPFVAISSDAVKAFLRGIVGIDLDQLWNERVVGADNNEQRLRAAGEVRALLKQKCNEKSDAITALANFEKMFGEEGQLVDLFLSDERVQQNKVMVRSTGREDTTTLANAGGNTSVPNVAISFTEVFGAIKKVIFSYVSEKSLSQRLDAGDDIRAVPFVPLLMQVMVGEDMSVPEKERFIPRCGVLYTEEQEGGCFYATNKKYFSGITLIQAAYGHNELVVNSLGKVDTFLVDENHTVRQVIRHKPFRLVPGESKKLVKERNKDNSSQKPALLSAAVKALKMVADRLDQRALRSKNNDEKAPQDVEFVVANENGHDIIYLVQARPLVAKQYERKPSYVPLGFFDGAVKVFGEVVGVAGGAVRTVHDKTEALTATTLYGALNSELPRRPAEEKDKIEAVFVEEVAAETSHEANSMALLKKPVICLGSEYEKVLDWLTDPTHDVVFDPQQSCVLLYDKSAGDVPVIAGWCAYPLVRFLSVPEVEGERLAAVIARADGDFKTQRSIGYRELRAQLVVLKNGTPEAMANAAAAIWGYIKHLHESLVHKLGNEGLRPKGEGIRGSYLERLASIRFYIAQALRQCLSRKSKECSPGEPGYLGLRLYPIHFLEMLLFQQTADEACLYADSVTMLQKALAKELIMARKLKEDAGGLVNKSEAKALLSMLESQAFRDETKEKWKAFVRANFSSNIVEGSAQDFFLRNLRLLKDLDVLSLWLNTSFAASQDLESLNAEIAQSAEFIGELRGKKEELENIDVSVFADPKAFWSVWINFKMVADYFMGEEFGISFTERKGSLSRLVAVQTMGRLIELHDKVIKVVAGSGEFEVLESKSTRLDGSFFNESGLFLRGDNEVREQICARKDKTFTFCFLLVYYANLLKRLYFLMREQGYTLPDFSVDSGFGSYSLDTVINEWLVKHLWRISHVHPLRHLSLESFDVNKIMIGQRVRFNPDGDFMPKTYEAYFTFVHQALLVLIGRFMVDICPLQRLPSFCTEFDTMLHNGNSSGSTSVIKMVGIECSRGGSVEVHYAITLFAHGANLRVQYASSARTCSIDFRIIGPEGTIRGVSHNDRWKKSLGYLQYKEKQIFGGAHMQYSVDRDGINVRWQSCSLAMSEEVVVCVKTLCSLSFVFMSHAFRFQGQDFFEFFLEARKFCKATGEDGERFLSELWFKANFLEPDDLVFKFLEEDFALLDWNFSLSLTIKLIEAFCATPEHKNRLQNIIYTHNLSRSLALCMVKAATRGKEMVYTLVFDAAWAANYHNKIIDYYREALSWCKRRETFSGDQTYLFFLQETMHMSTLKERVIDCIQLLYTTLVTCLPEDLSNVRETAEKMRIEAIASVESWQA